MTDAIAFRQAARALFRMVDLIIARAEQAAGIFMLPWHGCSRADNLLSLLADCAPCDKGSDCEWDLDGDEIVGPAELRILVRG